MFGGCETRIATAPMGTARIHASTGYSAGLRVSGCVWQKSVKYRAPGHLAGSMWRVSKAG